MMMYSVPARPVTSTDYAFSRPIAGGVPFNFTRDRYYPVCRTSNFTRNAATYTGNVDSVPGGTNASLAYG